jgi:uncharacterized protein YcfJ
MKKLFALILVASAGMGTCVSSQAQEVATVVSVQPRYVTVQQRQCGVQEVVRENDTTGGKVVGGVAGAAIGSTIGGNSRDRLVGGVVGALVGGAIGNEVARGPDIVEQRQVCRYVPVTMQQGSMVTFNYRGQIFTQAFSQ